MVANPFSQVDDNGYPVRIADDGIEPNMNVYYRKMKVVNLT